MAYWFALFSNFGIWGRKGQAGVNELPPTRAVVSNQSAEASGAFMKIWVRVWIFTREVQIISASPLCRLHKDHSVGVCTPSARSPWGVKGRRDGQKPHCLALHRALQQEALQRIDKRDAVMANGLYLWSLTDRWKHFTALSQHSPIHTNIQSLVAQGATSPSGAVASHAITHTRIDQPLGAV